VEWAAARARGYVHCSPTKTKKEDAMGHRQDDRDRNRSASTNTQPSHDGGYRYAHIPGQRWSSGYGDNESVGPASREMPGRGFSGNDFGPPMVDGRVSGYGSHGSDMGMGAPPEDRGPHYGKGPKGYKRSDERIREDVCEVIANQGHIDATDVEVKVENGIVTLTGTVGQRQQKRALEHMIEHTRGVEDIHNQVRLRAERAPERAPEPRVAEPKNGAASDQKNGKVTRAPS
jgi:hypothetical protein